MKSIKYVTFENYELMKESFFQVLHIETFDLYYEI